MIEKILPQEQVQKSEHRELSRLRSKPRKNYKNLSKILRKIEFQQQLDFEINNLYTPKSF